MSLRAAVLGSLMIGGLVAAVYHAVELLDPRDDVWFAGLAAGIGLVTVPTLIDVAVVEVLGRALNRSRRLAVARGTLVVGSGFIGIALVGWVSVRAARDPFIGYALVLLPLLVFALGALIAIYVLVAGADRPEAMQR
jgi:hypothetical protein